MIVFLSLATGVALFLALLVLPVPATIAALAIGGVVVGLAPGAILAMPGRILPDEARAFRTGVFHSIYSLQMMSLPPLAGAIADRRGDVSLAVLPGSVMLALALVALGGFARSAPAPRTDPT